MLTKASGSVHKYFREAGSRAAARRRLPVWLALLMPFIGLFFVFCITVALGLIGIHVYQVLHPRLPQDTISLIFGGAFIAAIAPGFIVANLALWLVPPIRQILDANAKGARRLSFLEGIKGLVKVGLVTVPVGLVLILIAVDLR